MSSSVHHTFGESGHVVIKKAPLSGWILYGNFLSEVPTWIRSWPSKTPHQEEEENKYGWQKKKLE